MDADWRACTAVTGCLVPLASGAEPYSCGIASRRRARLASSADRRPPRSTDTRRRNRRRSGPYWRWSRPDKLPRVAAGLQQRPATPACDASARRLEHIPNRYRNEGRDDGTLPTTLTVSGLTASAETASATSTAADAFVSRPGWTAKPPGDSRLRRVTGGGALVTCFAVWNERV